MKLTKPFFGYSVNSPSPFRESVATIAEWRIRHRQFLTARTAAGLDALANAQYKTAAAAELAIEPLRDLAKQFGIEVVVAEKSTLSL